MEGMQSNTARCILLLAQGSLKAATFQGNRQSVSKTTDNWKSAPPRSFAVPWQVALEARCVACHGHQGTPAQSFSQLSTFQADAKHI